MGDQCVVVVSEAGCDAEAPTSAGFALASALAFAAARRSSTSAAAVGWIRWKYSFGFASCSQVHSNPSKRSVVLSSNAVSISIASNGQTSTQIWQLMQTETSMLKTAG